MTLHGDRFGAGQPALTFVHGFTQTARSWRPIAEVLARHHRVALVDAPGHGGSREVRADLVEGARLLADVGGRSVYIGYSMGGRLCLQLAVDHPDIVDGLVLVSATAGLDDAHERDDRVAADERLAATLEHDGVAAFIDRWLAGPLFATLPTERAGVADRLTNDGPGLASSLRLAGTGTMAPLWDRLGGLDVPVLVVTGALDERFTTLGARLAGTIGASATLATIEGAGHSAHLERPHEFLSLLQGWLDTKFT